MTDTTHDPLAQFRQELKEQDRQLAELEVHLGEHADEVFSVDTSKLAELEEAFEVSVPVAPAPSAAMRC